MCYKAYKALYFSDLYPFMICILHIIKGLFEQNPARALRAICSCSSKM